MRLTGAQILCESLIREGVDTIFGLPGGAILPVYDTLPQYPQLRHILVRHEQGAAHAADGYARVTGRVGVCLATSGPGATNLVTGIANAHLDSSPMVAITGQVPMSYIGRDSFQEIDITGITLPITKHNYLVTRPEDIAETVKEAFHIASTGRPGPVLIDLPRDVQVGEAAFSYPEKVGLRGYKPTLQGHPTQIKKAAKLIAEAWRPLILAGHGIILSRAYTELRDLAEKAQIPVVTTLLGISSFPESHLLSFGFMGMHGMMYANLAVNSADLLIAVGMRYDDRATGRVSAFAPHAQVIHVDVDPAELGKNVRVNVPIVGDVKNVLSALNAALPSLTHLDWINELEQWRREHPSLTIRETSGLLPQYVIRQLYEVTRGEATIVADVGQNQMWAAQHYWYDRPNTYITSGGLGTMGFALPAAMGVKVGKPEEAVWAICGDGGFQMTMHELATMVQEDVAVKIAIINNQHLGMVRQLQDIFCDSRYVATPLSGPDFVKLAEAYGILGIRVQTKEQVAPAIRQAMQHPGPVIVEFVVEPYENVYPVVAAGNSLAQTVEDPRQEPVKVRPHPAREEVPV